MGSFLTKLSTAQGNEKFPIGKDSQRSLMKGLESWAKYAEPAISEQPKKVTTKAADRLKELLLLAKHEGATDEKDAANDQLIATAPLASEGDKANGSDDVNDLEDTEVSNPEEVV